MEYLKTVLLGIIQGVTEWLPISSTGHLLLFDELVGLKMGKEARSVFMVVIQLGSILAVVVLYLEKLWPFKRSREERRKSFVLWAKVLAASIPAAIAGLLLDDIIDSHLSSPLVISASLAVYGVLYIYLEKRMKIEVRVESVEDITYRDALRMGLFQMLALIPGTSRSGSTILGGLVCGIGRSAAAEFSFFMALPVMAGASLLRLVKHGMAFTAYEWRLLAIGSFVAFAVSLVSIRALVGYVRKHDFAIFGVYRIVLAIVVVITFALR